MEMPTKNEMLNRIIKHRSYRDDSDIVNLLWKGYLTALNEWGLLSDEDYEDVVRRLKHIGAKELEEPLFPSELLESDDPLPTLKEIEAIIDKSVETHGGSETIILLWQGYLAALQEWARFLGADNYHHLRERLGDIGDQEIQEIFLGLPDEYDPDFEEDSEPGL